MLTFAEVCNMPDSEAIAYMQGLSSKEKIMLLGTITDEMLDAMKTYPLDIVL